MRSHEDIAVKLRGIDRTSVDYLAVLNFLDTDIPHADVDVMAILRTGANVKSSQFTQLKAFMSSFNKLTQHNSHAFASFRHQMFFEEELRRNGIMSVPVHLLVYPGCFYLQKWEIPSRIRSMVKTSQHIYQSHNWKLTTVSLTSPSTPYQPFVFLQSMYEAYILWSGSNIVSRAVNKDVLKKLEFSCKNLAIEALLKSEGMTRKFNTSWSYLIDHLSQLEQEGVPVHVIERAWAIKKAWGDNIEDKDLKSYFDDAFAFYDATVKTMFFE